MKPQNTEHLYDPDTKPDRLSESKVVVFCIRHKNARREFDQRGKGIAHIGFEVVETNQGLAIDIMTARLDQRLEQVLRQCVTAPRIAKSRSNRMAGGLLGSPPLYDIAPPLQAYLAGQRLAHTCAYVRNFQVEGIERIKRLPPISRREQAGEVTVLVAVEHQIFAILGSREHEAQASLGGVKLEHLTLSVILRCSPIQVDLGRLGLESLEG